MRHLRCLNTAALAILMTACGDSTGTEDTPVAMDFAGTYTGTAGGSENGVVKEHLWALVEDPPQISDGHGRLAT